MVGWVGAVSGMPEGWQVEGLIRLKLLGSFALSVGDETRSTIPLRGRALLAWLALHDRPVPREALVELLWPDRGPEQAQHSLKQAVYVLRRDGCSALITRGNVIVMKPGAWWSDVQALREALSDSHSAGCGAGDWQALAALYPASLLDGFPPISPAFDDFISAMRRSLEADVLDAMGRFADLAEREGAGSDRVAMTEHMLTIDPLREDTHRRLIAAYASVGRRTDAMRVYHEAKLLLRRELDVAPSAETEALVARVRDGSAEVARETVPASVGRSGPPRIAVLPLRQMGDAVLPSHVADGITGDIISQLVGLRELTVISHGSTYGLRDATLQPWEIGQKLNAQYLVMGRVRCSGDRLRLTMELTEAATGDAVYSHNDDMVAGLSFDEQDRIVGRLVNTLVPQVRETELRRIRGKRPTVLSVYEKVLLAREKIMLMDRKGFAEAKLLLDEVIQEDPGYAEAYALEAEWHGTMVGEGWTDNRAVFSEMAETFARTAMDIESCNVRALINYAHRRSNSYRDQTRAKKLFEKALDAAPSSAIAWALSGLCFAFSGDGTEAVHRATRALELSPVDREAYKFYHALCVANYSDGAYDTAADWGLRALGERTAWRGTRGFVAASLSATGRISEAREIVTEMVARSPGRRVNDVVAELSFSDVSRRNTFGQQLCAAGYPE